MIAPLPADPLLVLNAGSSSLKFAVFPLDESLERVAADVVIAATPVDLARLVAVSKPVVRARYEFAEADRPGLGALVDAWLASGAPPPHRGAAATVPGTVPGA